MLVDLDLTHFDIDPNLVVLVVVAVLVLVLVENSVLVIVLVSLLYLNLNVVDTLLFEHLLYHHHKLQIELLNLLNLVFVPLHFCHIL